MINEVKIIEIIKDLAIKEGFSAIGFSKADVVEQRTAEAYNSALKNGFFADMDYLKKNCDKRFDPRLLVEGAKSIIVFLAPFGDNKFIEEKKYTQPHISQYARGKDYHKVIKDKLYFILKKIQEFDSSINGRPFTDSAPILERAWAQKAGLGFIGKNNFLISPVAGIRNFIGVLILNVELPDDYKNENRYNEYSCGKCTECLDACPTGALQAPFLLNANKCTSYLTIEKGDKKYNRTERIDYSKEINGWIFGCDECMDACPWNSKNRTSWPEFLSKQSLEK